MIEICRKIWGLDEFFEGGQKCSYVDRVFFCYGFYGQYNISLGGDIYFRSKEIRNLRLF